MLVEVSKVKVADRIRKDFGNIEELANDIKENGLINPPVVTPDFELIAGERRLRACKHLGYDQIEVRVMTVKDALHQLKLEISENENRKDFSFTEKMEWAEKLKKEYSKIAQQNKKSTQFGSTVRPNLGKPMRTDDQVAREVGIGGRETYRKAEYIYQNADDDIIQQLNEEKISIHKAWVETKKKLEQVEKEKANLEKELQNRPIIETEKIITQEVYPKDYHQIKNDLEALKHESREKSKNNIKQKTKSITEEFQENYKFRINDFISAINNFSISINPFIFMDNYYKKMEQKHKDFLLKEVSQLEEDIKNLKNQIKYQGGIINE